MKKRITNRYYFSVEGECEKLYLQRLDNIIKGENSPFNVAFSVKVEKHPLKYIKALPITEKTTVYHLIDFGDMGETEQKTFKNALDNMKEAQKYKSVIYKLGYSNLTFELWLILHKIKFTRSIASKSTYLNIKKYSKHLLTA
ncbi:MAG: RloB domain-containing protein [Firmicutes bacterium]|nr:RloB domain-containing protein [Bacillota bacterium]